MREPRRGAMPSGRLLEEDNRPHSTGGSDRRSLEAVSKPGKLFRRRCGLFRGKTAREIPVEATRNFASGMVFQGRFSRPTHNPSLVPGLRGVRMAAPGARWIKVFWNVYYLNSITLCKCKEDICQGWRVFPNFLPKPWNVGKDRRAGIGTAAEPTI